MNRRHVLAAVYLGISACATSGPELPTPDAKVESSVITSDPTAADDEIHSIDAPEVPKTANFAKPAESPGQPGEIICRDEQRTNSHPKPRVCRTRLEIEEMSKEAQARFRRLRK